MVAPRKLILSYAQFIVVVGILLSIAVPTNAQQVVYKWVDEDGVVHFSDAPPEGSNPADTETLVTAKSPRAPVPAQSVANTAAPSVTAAEIDSPESEIKTPVLYEKADIGKMSLADLDLRCEEAREKMIAPLREAEIAKCKQDERNDPAFCERFNADYGDGGRTASGAMRPRMFDDLPECIEALQERNRRSR